MGFFDSIVEMFSGGNDPDAAKKKRLKSVAKSLAASRYAKYYSVKSEELEPALAKFIYDIYKIVSGAQALLANAAKSDSLKAMTVELFMDKDLKEINDRLSPDLIAEKAKTAQVKDIVAAAKKDIAALNAGFDSNKVGAIDGCYNSITAFVNFVSFDFYFFLKKFDDNITERNFTYKPAFEAVRGADLVNELKDFMEVSANVETEQDWKMPLAVLKQYKEGVDVVNADLWAKAVRFLRDVGRSRILELIVQHISGDPLWQSVSLPPDEHIADAFIDKKKADIDGAINKIQNDKRGAQIEQLAKSIFGSAEVERLENYTNKASDPFVKKGFDGFTKVEGLNYLKAFCLDYFKKEIHDLCDLLLIRGQWTSNVLSQQMSDSFHELSGLADKLPAFDAALSDGGEHGSRLRQCMLKVDRDKGQRKYITIILKTVNNDAQRMINAASQCLIAIGRNLKNLLEDSQKKPAELIMNWKELESQSETPLPQRIAEDYKKLYYFVQLLQFYAGPVEEE